MVLAMLLTKLRNMLRFSSVLCTSSGFGNTVLEDLAQNREVFKQRHNIQVNTLQKSKETSDQKNNNKKHSFGSWGSLRPPQALAIFSWKTCQKPSYVRLCGLAASVGLYTNYVGLYRLNVGACPHPVTVG